MTLFQIRTSLGFSQAEMASYLGISRSAVSMAEQFKRGLNRKSINNLRLFEESIRKAESKLHQEQRKLDIERSSVDGFLDGKFVEGLA